MQKFIGLLGIVVLLGIAYLLCPNKKALHYRTLVIGFFSQVVLALMVLKGEWLSSLFSWFNVSASSAWLFFALEILILMYIGRAAKLKSLAKSIPMKPVRYILGIQALVFVLKFNSLGFFFQTMHNFVDHLLSYAGTGAQFVFGPLATKTESLGVIFAFYVLPTIIFVSSLFAILYYLGIMQIIVRFLAKIMHRFLNTSGAESLAVAANIFMGQTEAPLTVRPFLAGMTQSELFTLMVSGMAHVSGGIMVAYVAIAHVDITHLLTAVIMTAPGAIMIAKLMMPETGKPSTHGDVKVEIPNHDVNLIDAASRGAGEGMQLAINVAAMLISFIALVALVNGIFGFVHGYISFFPTSLQQLLSWVFAPLAYVMGFPAQDIGTIGNLLGTRMVLNEFVAFISLGDLKATLDPKSFVMVTYALCGFANLSSIAIQVGGIGALAPSRRGDLARLGMKAVIGGTIANFLTATIVGLLY